MNMLSSQCDIPLIHQNQNFQFASTSVLSRRRKGHKGQRPQSFAALHQDSKHHKEGNGKNGLWPYAETQTLQNLIHVCSQRTIVCQGLEQLFHGLTHLHEGNQLADALLWHGIVDGCTHAADRPVACASV